MRHFVWLLLMTVLPGCHAQPTEQESKPIPPDDMSNGPWKNQRQQRAGQQQAASQSPTSAEPD